MTPESRPSGGCDVFISYRRKTGGDRARLFYDRLRALGYAVEMDVEALPGGGRYDEAIDAHIKTARDVLLILTPSDLERCQDAHDWLRRELANAIRHGRNIVPVMDPLFTWPKDLPADLPNLDKYNGITYSNEHFPHCMDEVKRLLSSRPLPLTFWRRHRMALWVGFVLCLVLAVWTAAKYASRYWPAR